jgi:hypothetical protein
MGCSWNRSDINESQFHSIQGHSIRIFNPFWFHFVDKSSHFVFQSKLLFNLSWFIRFKPSSLYIPSINVFTVRYSEFNVTNTQTKETVEIYDVPTFSRHIFLGALKRRLLKPGESLTVNVYFCRTAAVAFSALVIVDTSKGQIPSSIASHSTFSPQGLIIPTVFRK